MGAIAEAVAGLAGSAFNSIYTIYRNQQLDRREDNAIQRRMADLQAAGLNPLLAANGNGAGASAGLSTNLDTSGLANVSQTLYNIRNRREEYKQNQLYTKLLEQQVADGKLNAILNNLQFNALMGTNFSGGRSALYNRFGDLKGLPTYRSNGSGIIDDMNNSPFFKTLQNEVNFGLNQTLFNLKTQGYMNGLGLAQDTIAPLLQLGQLFNFAGQGYSNFFGRKNFNSSQYQGTTSNYNHNYNYRQR